MSIRDVMMIQDAIENTNVAAGSGDFSRTLFSYSPEITVIPKVTDDNVRPLILSKFITPKAGIYKYEFEYNLIFPCTFHTKLRISNLIFPQASSQPIPPTDEIGNRTNSYMGRSIGEELEKVHYSTLDKACPNWISTIINQNSTFSSTTCYFPAMEGQVFFIIAPCFLSNNSSYINTKTLIVRNQKITY